MQFLTDQANIFFITAAEVGRNELPTLCKNLKTFIEAGSADDSFIFIEVPPFRWEKEVECQMALLESRFDGKHSVHPLIISSEVYKEMQLRNARHDDGFETERKA